MDSLVEILDDSLIEEISEPESIVSYIDDNSENERQTVDKFAVTPVCRPITDYRNNLTEVEGNYLTELLNATNILKTPMGTVASEASTLFDALHVLSSAKIIDIQRYVSMSKNLMAFKNICQKDRLSLLIPGFFAMFFVRNVTGYFNDNDKEYIIVPTVSLDLF